MVIALFATTTKTKHKNVYHFEYVEKSRGPTSERSRPTVHRAAIERDAFGPRTDPLDIKHVDRTVAASYVCVCDANCCFFSVFFRFYNYIESGSPCHAFDLANDFRFAQIVYVFAFSLLPRTSYTNQMHAKASPGHPAIENTQRTGSTKLYRPIFVETHQ